jgi:protein-tyrosine phosphatase
MTSKYPVRVLFVCLGNICRSPIVESVFRTLVVREGLSTEIATDSAGTGDYQLGQPPDPRAIRAARGHGYEIAERVARQVGEDDFRRFEWILAMDGYNLETLLALRPQDYAGYLGLFLDFAPELGLYDIPDPYHGAMRDFERVVEIAERGAPAVLAAVRAGMTQTR